MLVSVHIVKYADRFKVTVVWILPVSLYLEQVLMGAEMRLLPQWEYWPLRTAGLVNVKARTQRLDAIPSALSVWIYGLYSFPQPEFLHTGNESQILT